jgi:hypothetical protein
VLLPLPPFMVATVTIMHLTPRSCERPAQSESAYRRYRIRGKLPIAPWCLAEGSHPEPVNPLCAHADERIATVAGRRAAALNIGRRTR